MPPPPDGGSGWVIVFAGFTINILNNGSTLALGVFFETFVTHFATSHQSIAIANSINLGVLMCAMPINSALVNLFGCRKMCFLGGLVYSLGFFLTTLSDNVYIFYLTYGVVLGWSCGLILLSWMGLVSFYFEKKRSLANAICASGAPIGGAAWSPFGSYLIQLYGWKTTFWIFGGINLLICLLSILLKPLVLVPESCDTSITILSEDDMKHSIRSKENDQDNIIGSKGTNSNIQLTKYRRDSIISSCNMYPYSSSIERENGIENNDVKTTNSFKNSIHGQSYNSSIASPSLFTNIEINEEYKKNGTHPKYEIGVLNMICLQTTPQLEDCIKSDDERRHSVIVFGVGDKTSISLQPDPDIFSRRESYCIVRPLSRVDSFYDRSLSRLDLASRESQNEHNIERRDNFTITEKSLIRCRRSVASLQSFNYDNYTDQDRVSGKIKDTSPNILPRASILAQHVRMKKGSIQDSNMKKEFHSQTLSLVQTIQSMLDISYLKKPLFLLVCLSRFFGDFSYFIPWTFLPSMMEEKEINPTQASFLLSILGITCLISRLISGFILDRPKIPSPVASTVSTTVAGISMLLLPFCSSLETFAAVGCLYGLFSGGYIISQPIILVDMFGIESLMSALGIFIFLFNLRY